MVMLRDGRTLIAYLRSLDQFGTTREIEREKKRENNRLFR